MSNKLVITISLLTIMVFLPFLMMYLNLAGFTELNTELVTRITGKDFNIITLSGFTDVINFFLGLAFFSFSGLHPLILAFLGLISLIGFVVAVYFARGGGS